MPINARNPFKGRQYPGEVIVLCVRWYLRYPLSYEHVSELVAERGVEVDASCIWRWVQAYAPELNKRCRPYLKPTNKSYRIDETYIKVKGEDRYLYRALDSTGQTIDFLLTAKRDAAAAKRFLRGAGNVRHATRLRIAQVGSGEFDGEAYPAARQPLVHRGFTRKARSGADDPDASVDEKRDRCMDDRSRRHGGISVPASESRRPSLRGADVRKGCLANAEDVHRGRWPTGHRTA
jgi:hypothetical protein